MNSLDKACKWLNSSSIQWELVNSTHIVIWTHGRKTLEACDIERWLNMYGLFVSKESYDSIADATETTYVKDVADQHLKGI